MNASFNFKLWLVMSMLCGLAFFIAGACTMPMQKLLAPEDFSCLVSCTAFVSVYMFFNIWIVSVEWSEAFKKWIATFAVVFAFTLIAHSIPVLLFGLWSALVVFGILAFIYTLCTE